MRSRQKTTVPFNEKPTNLGLVWLLLIKFGGGLLLVSILVQLVYWFLVVLRIALSDNKVSEPVFWTVGEVCQTMT